jgi:hypothetical protein
VGQRVVKFSGAKPDPRVSAVGTRASSWGPHVRFRRVTLVREGSPLVKLRNSASKVQSVDQRMRLERGVGFRQLRTCRRTRPGQLCAKSGRTANREPPQLGPHGVILLDNLVSYLGIDGMAEEWWSTISQRSPFLT